MAGISLRHIAKTYPGNVKVVPDLSLEIEDKEFIVLVGSSGCGKSTTLRMIAGLEDITGGELYIGDKLVNDVAPKDRDIAMVFQNYALYPHMTVYKNIAFGMNLRKEDKTLIDKKVKEVAKSLDIEYLLNRKPKELSGGQRQRVALGRAMVRKPEVFLLDEPLSNLDAKLRGEMRSVITKLHKDLQTTFVYVTHDQVEAMTMADRIVVMNEGIIQQVDTPQNLYDKPCNMFVAGFIGMPQMNFINCKLEKIENDFYISFDNYNILLPQSKNKNKKLDEYVGKEVIAGIRPSDIYLEANDEKFRSSKIKTQIELTEMMGSESYIYAKFNQNKLTIRTKGNLNYKFGEYINAFLNIEKIHLFDSESRVTICN